MLVFITVRNEVAKVMFLQVSVCPQGGGGIPTCLAGGIPACLAAGLQGVVPALGGVPAPGGLVPGVPTLGGLVPGGCLLGGVWRPPERKTATVADGKHPTGMHSCYHLLLCFKSC